MIFFLDAGLVAVSPHWRGHWFLVGVFRKRLLSLKALSECILSLVLHNDYVCSIVILSHMHLRILLSAIEKLSMQLNLLLNVREQIFILEICLSLQKHVLSRHPPSV